MFPVQKFPALNGRYQTVGVTSFYIQQKTIEEQPCELVVKCFYPSSESPPSSPPNTPYMSVEQATALAAFAHIPSVFFTHVAKIQVRAVEDASWLSSASASSPLPVLIYSHGLGGIPETYQVQATHLASHGFVVLLPTHNDGSAALSILPDNRPVVYQPLATADSDEKTFRSKQLVERVRDILFLVDCVSHSNPDTLTAAPLPAFWPLLNPKQIGLIGHSFGAASVMAAAALEQQQQAEWYQSTPRIKAVISHDQWMLPVHHLIKNVSLTIPTLITVSEGFKKWDSNYSVLLRLYRSFPPDSPSLMLYIAQSAHSNFSDVGLYFSAFLARLSHQIGNIDHVYCWRMLNDCNVTWMSRWMQIPIDNSVDQNVLDAERKPADVIFIK